MFQIGDGYQLVSNNDQTIKLFLNNSYYLEMNKELSNLWIKEAFEQNYNNYIIISDIIDTELIKLFISMDDIVNFYNYLLCLHALSQPFELDLNYSGCRIGGYMIDDDNYQICFSNMITDYSVIISEDNMQDFTEKVFYYFLKDSCLSFDWFMDDIL